VQGVELRVGGLERWLSTFGESLGNMSKWPWDTSSNIRWGQVRTSGEKHQCWHPFTEHQYVHQVSK